MAPMRLQRRLLEPEARQHHFKRHACADVAEGCAVKVESDRLGRTVFRFGQPHDARLAVDVAPDQPRARQSIDPRTPTRRPHALLVVFNA